ncbi:hypothetical protein PAXRUDRAFT_528806 [Paxillus rubicundulus Ve08.2h10]|uniref:Secreted protein n=1 Tax=Paxillus rubicundulus Ve08.2h10 TaxID=930991 RepID=A0A0D0DBP1_9AGAM|nr:hypothetical protein PAXRUDRAFT_528806 [Paxillus rubicundulus Ve08.2h10]
MKTFLVLLTTITSLSAYTLVGVQADCPVCPPSMGGVKLHDGCTSNGDTVCWYQLTNQEGSFRFCEYEWSGILKLGGAQKCPSRVQTGTAANCDSICYS